MTPHARVPAALLLLAAATAAHAATVTELPMLPAPTSPYPPAFTAAPRPVHINAGGDVLGTVTFTRKACGSCTAQTIRRSFLVSNGVATQEGIDEFIASDMNDAGEIVGNWRDTWGTGATWAYRIDAGAMVPLDTVPHSVIDVNNRGEVSFGPYFNDHGVQAALMSDTEHGTHVFKWAGEFPANDVSCSVPSQLYECVTGMTTGFDAVHALNDGATPAEAMAVGEDRDNPWSSSYGRQHAFVGWQGVTTDLSSGFTAAALAVNDAGLIVGYDDGQAVLWAPDAAGGWSEHTVASLVNDPSWTFRQATTVNDAGVVAGWGTHDGAPAMFLLTNGLVAAEPPAAGAAAVRFSAYPNPARGAVRFRGTLPASAAIARITVVDVSGRRVASVRAPLTNGAFDAGWDGRAANGDALRAGMYFARIEAGGRVARTAVMIAR